MWGTLIIWSLVYVVCCVLQLTAAQCDGGAPLTLTEQGLQEFTTPNFPDGRYPVNARCSWLIQVTSGTIELKFPDFNLPPELVWGNAECATTKVEVYNGPTASSPLLGTYCTNTPPPAVTSSSGISMLVSFTGGSFAVRGQGFRATFTVTGGDAVTTASPLLDSTTSVHMTASPLISTLPPTTSTLHSPTPLSSTEMPEAPTTPVPETTTAQAFTTTILTTTTPEPIAASTPRPQPVLTSPAPGTSEGPTTVLETTTVPAFPTTVWTTTPSQSTTISTTPTNSIPQDSSVLPTTTTHRTTSSPQDTTNESSQTTTQPTSAPSTTLQEDTTTLPPTNSSPQGSTALPSTTTHRTTSSPQDTTNETLQSSPSQTTFAASPIGVVTTTKTTSDKFETGQPFNTSTIIASTVDSVTETTRPITKSTRHPDMKPTVMTGKPGTSEEQSGGGGLTEDQIIMYAAIGGALAGLLFVGMVAAVYFCRGQRQGRFEKSYAIGFQELETLDGEFGHAINNPVYDRSDADGTGRYNPAHLEASRPDSAYQSLQGSLQGSWASSIDSQQDVEMDVKL